MNKEKKKIFESKKDVFNFIIGIILLGLLLYISVIVATYFIIAVKKVFDNYTTISVAIITGLLAFISAIVGKFLENRYTIKNQIRKEKQTVYINFLEWLINNVLNAEIRNNSNVVEEIKEQQKLMTIYASDKVLKTWSEFKYISMNSVMNNSNLSKDEKTKIFIKEEAPYIEKLILAIRKELGYKNKNIKTYDILKLYINDINKYI